jgi:hypothetical protein
LPTISRSIEHAAGVKATSISLSEKAQKLAGHPSTRAYESQQSNSLVLKLLSERPPLSVFDRLWLHLQKNLLTRATPPLQAFVAPNAEVTSKSISDEIIEYTDHIREANGLDHLGDDDEDASVQPDYNTTQHTVSAAHLDKHEGQGEHQGYGSLTKLEDELLFDQRQL